MATSIYNRENVNKDIKFLSKHIGGENNDNQRTLEQQLQILKSEDSKPKIKNDFVRTIGRDTVVGQNNVSNPVIVPKDHDLYIEYLNKLNLDSTNTRVLQQFYYVNVDSSFQVNNVNTNYNKLEKDPLIVYNNSNIMKIKVPDETLYEIGDKITIQGLAPNTIQKDNVTFTFENGSNRVLTNLDFDFNYTNKFYKVLIDFQNISTPTNMFENIPMATLNQTQNVYIYNNQLAFNIPLTFYSNIVNTSFTSSTKLTFNNIGNVPINIINAYSPSGKINLNLFQLVSNKFKNYIEVSLPISFSLKTDMLKFGGDNIQIGKVDIPENVNAEDLSLYNIQTTDVNQYVYVYDLNNRFENVICVKIISSELTMPTQNQNKFIVNNTNNKFNWKNATEENENQISIPTGYYDFPTLATTMEDLISKIPRKPFDSLYPFNIIKCNFDVKSNFYELKSYSKYILPLCFTNFVSNPNSYIITINQQDHTLKIGDTIEIQNAIDYYTISKDDINKTHVITNSYKDYYEITLTNINLIPDVGNTKGGFKTQIITDNPFEALFDRSNSIGKQLQFKNVGSSASVTNFLSQINNDQQYLYTEPNQIINANVSDLNFPYILLNSNRVFNQAINPYKFNYFYKFLLNNSSTNENNILYNSFVDTPIYFNPPLSYLDSLRLIFTTPNGDPISIQTFKYSFTLEIITIANALENTNININIGKI